MYKYKAKIIRVVDGDTVDVDIDLGFGVWLNNQRIRLYGIDTPECRTRDKVEKYFGLMSKALVKDFLKEGSIQHLSTSLSKSRKGKFGRILGQFWIYDPWTDRQTTLNSALLVRNYAVKYEGQSKEEIKESHLNNRKIIWDRLGYGKKEFSEIQEKTFSEESYKMWREDVFLQATNEKGS